MWGSAGFTGTLLSRTWTRVLGAGKGLSAGHSNRHCHLERIPPPRGGIGILSGPPVWVLSVFRLS